MLRFWRITALAVALPLLSYLGPQSLFAQGPPDGPGGDFHGGPGGPPGGPGGFMGPGGAMAGFHGKTVTGLPYSASMSNEVTRHLADGNTIERKTSGTVARDSAGRTYEQVTITGGPLGETGSRSLIFISDPVAGYVYTLNINDKTAMQRKIPAPSANAGQRPNPPRHSALDVIAADLQPDTSSGVAATGKSYTRTVPAGAMGNSQPIVSVTQVWTASDLEIVVRSVRNDPMFGDSTYVLSNVSAKEPDASLFKVPSDYTVRTSADHGGRRRGFGGPDAGPPPQE